MATKIKDLKTVSLIKADGGEHYQICMPDGTPIPNIISDSIFINADTPMFRGGFCHVQLTVMVRLENINPRIQ
jgi:hypothetical protein